MFCGLPSACNWAKVRELLIVILLRSPHVHGNLGPRRRRTLPAWHDRDDGWPEDAGRHRPARDAQQGGGDAAARLVLGRYRYAAGAIFQCNDHDDDRTRQRGLVDVRAGARPRLWRECRHHWDGLAGRAHRRARLAHRRGAADDLRRCVDQASDPGASIRDGRRARRIRACAFWADDPAGGHGRAGRTTTPGGPACRSRRSRSPLVVEPVRRAGAGRDRTGDDGADAVVNGRRGRDLVRSLRRGDRAGPGLCADHRPEHRDSDEFRPGRDWRKHHRPEAGHRLRSFQAHRGSHRAGAFSLRRPPARACLEQRRRRDAACRVSYGV